MKNQAWKDETLHLEEIIQDMNQRVDFEEQRLAEDSLDQERQEFVTHTIEQLKELQNSPYFGRIDVSFEGEEGMESMYIGPTTFFGENDEVEIYDWRAPIASLFYEGTLGELEYETPNGKQLAHAYLKRDIVIRKKEIQSIYDVDNQESRLMETLSASSNKEGHLEGITATIQKEQNEIIRHRQKDWLIVDGCAGSGKTTILLQRIAYIMYQAKKQHMNDMLLLSRNQLFAKYISHVIPSLTGSELYQKTIWQKTMELFERFHLDQHVIVAGHHKIAYDQKYAYLLDEDWLAVIGDYMDTCQLGDIYFQPLTIRGVKIFSQRDFQKLCEQINPTLNLHQQLTLIQTALQKNLKRRLNKFFVSQRAQRYYEMISPGQLEVLTREEEFNGESDYYQFIGRKIFKKDVESIEEQIENFAFVNVAKHLQQIMPKAKQLHQAKNRPLNSALPIKKSEEGQYLVTAEGVRVLLYLATRIAPVRSYDGYSHLFIDEVQDVSLLLMATLSNYYFRAKFTVVGDTHQGFNLGTTIFYLESEFPELSKLAFPDRQLEYRSLEISYRCTAQITRCANGIMNWRLDRNVFPRTGEEVIYWQSNQEDPQIIEQVIQADGEKWNTTAIICRSMKEARQLATSLAKYGVVLLEDGSEYSGNSWIVSTIDIVKGLEFDRVVLTQVSEVNYQSTMEQLMLYTSCTRAKHELQLIVPTENPSHFVSESQAEMVKKSL
ncbi:DNA helicase-2 / ATP-dependent DNA helicase PcrA [Granulicatella balaenopterae]|uniref:DNA helicase-2 / ATP-dependent DNA helicase PcrA n=1 Tax=Granulicatella balaenopterae TaxID=137733 RepID=A0A1H9NET8_9LACT|nr:UvrD-helicase domain-containing protein [Granulicatella balaenopterae]SER34159.1 DNA helicase-2 / ATP-dependent DNA helicase PcrA [Granulicatella balaenopterae]